MRLCKISLILFILVLVNTATYASELFYKLNSDLRRVGLDEIKKMGDVEFEAGNYRLDPDFKLGYGDTVTMNFWGKLEAMHKLTIDREGNIVIPMLGKIGLIGLSLDEARSAVKRELDKKYTNVEFDLNLSDVQDIRITVLGNSANPGVYAVSPFCRIAEAIAKSGGPNTNGALSSIKLRRNGKEVLSFNVYDFILKGDQNKNIVLKHGDEIFIPEIKNLIAIRGDVRYPGIYDTEENLSLNKFIEATGGMLPTKFERKAIILRINLKSMLTEACKEIIFKPEEGIKPEDDIALENQDTVAITTALDYIPYPKDLYRVVHISGEVKISGEYLIIEESEKLSSILKRAGGLKDTAFAEGAVFMRNSVKQKQKSILDELIRTQERAILEEGAHLAEAILTQEERQMRQRALEYRRKVLNLMATRIPEGRIIIDLKEIIDGKADIRLEKGDNLYIPPTPDWVIVSGAVYNPQAVSFAEGKPLEYYLNAVGGPNKLADKDDIYIIKANGQAESLSTGYGKIKRGSIIVVPQRSGGSSKAT